MQFGGGGGWVFEEIDVEVELDDEGLDVGTGAGHELIKELFTGAALAGEPLAHAGAGLGDEAEGEREGCVRREKLDGLRVGVVRQCEVASCEVRDEVALFVVNKNRDDDVAVLRRGELGGRCGGGPRLRRGCGAAEDCGEGDGECEGKFHDAAGFQGHW